MKEPSGVKVIRENNPSPGQYDKHLIPFASSLNNITMGGKYKWQPDSNPPVGAYEVDSPQTLSKSQSTFIRKEYVPNKRAPEPTPEPYDGHLKSFGSDAKGAYDFGNKYVFKVNDVPPPGFYDTSAGDSILKSKSQSALI